MAKSNPRTGRGAQAVRATAKSKKSAGSDAEAVEEAPGIGLEAGIAILTCLVLVGALVVLDMMHAKFEHGMLF